MFTKTISQQLPMRRDLANVQGSALSRTKNARFPGFTLSRAGIFLFVVAALSLLVLPVSAFETPESIVAASKVYVSDVVYDPGTFFPGDTGTVTVYVKNANTNQSAVVNHASFGDENIRLTSKPYDSTTNIGPLQTQSFVFSVEASGKDTTYYPTFTLNFRDADSLYQRANVKIDSTPLVLTVVDKPDAYATGQKKTVYLQVANPRDNAVSNAILEVSGQGISATPEKIFIGDVSAGGKIPVNFTITADSPTNVNITLKYDNGDNTHQVSLDLPVTFGLDKKQANPQISNVQVKQTSGVYHVTGDVTNAGLTNANGVSVTTLSPAIPQDPYKSYVIGALKPDDFGSFEVTFNANGATTVPLQISYKDTDGNIVTSRFDVSISGASDTNTGQQGGNPLLPVIGIVIVIAIGGLYLYNKRRKNQ
jgi:LPXTG-motif cell wall-anchored protein